MFESSPSPAESSNGKNGTSLAYNKLKCSMSDIGDTGGKSWLINATENRSSASFSPHTFQELADTILFKLNTQGYCVVDKFHRRERALAILEEVKHIHRNGVMQNGMFTSSEAAPNFRGDQIAWVDGTETYTTNIFNHMKRVDMLVAILNNKIQHYNITQRTKAMVACYPGLPGQGRRYVKHVDNPSQDGRCITTLYYLNKDYNAEVDGGVLRLYPGNGETFIDLEPILDRFLVFWSDKRNPHEVLPAYNTRYAITLWYFDEEERKVEGERLRKLQQKMKQSKDQPHPSTSQN